MMKKYNVTILLSVMFLLAALIGCSSSKPMPERYFSNLNLDKRYINAYKYIASADSAREWLKEFEDYYDVDLQNQFYVSPQRN